MIGQCHGRSRAAWHRPTRAEREASALPGPSGHNGSARARERPNRCHRTPQAAAGVKVTKSLDRRSARCGDRLPRMGGGPGLPKGSASVVRQLGGMSTRNWSRTERQMACREALRADAGNKERRPGEKEARAWRAPHWREAHIGRGEEERKRPGDRSRKTSRPWSSWHRLKSRHRRPATGVSESEG